MKDPRRLLDGDGTEEQRALLRAGAIEEPAPDGHARLLAALGVTAPSIGAGPAGVHSAAPGAVPAGGGAAAGAAGATKLALLAVGSAVLLGAGALLFARGAGPAVQDAPPNARASKSESAAPPQRAHDQAGHDQAGHDQTGPSTGSVALEIEALERVRSELARKDGGAALAALSRYASEHPQGVLAHEADVLRVEALLLEGEAAAALELSEQLLRKHGDSPHRARLQALARQAGAPPAP